MIHKPVPHPKTDQKPETRLLATALLGTQHLTDAELLSTQLREPDIRRAEDILRTTNLRMLVHGGPLELMAHGFQEDEILRLMTLLELTIRAIAQHHRESIATHEVTNQETNGVQMPQNAHPLSVQLDSVVDPDSYLALALEGYSAPVETTNTSDDGDSAEA